MFQMLKKDVLLVLLIFILLKLPTLNTPFYQDELTLVDNSFLAVSHPAHFMHFAYVGHPPLIESILILAIKIFPWSLALPHLISLSFALIALYFFYKIIEFYSKKDALILTILLALTPVFFTQAGILNLDMPACALTLAMYYFYIKKRPMLFIVFSSLAILAKEPTFITYTVILIYDFFKSKTKMDYIKTRFYYAIPYALWGVWLVLSKIYNGWFVWPYHVKFIHPSFHALFFTFSKFRYILIPFILIPLIKRKKHSALLISIISSNILFFSFIFLPRYMTIVIPFVYILLSLVKTKWKYLAILILIILSSFLIYPDSKRILIGEETNMNYIKLIGLQKSGFEHIQNNSDVLMIWPHSKEASSQKYGYTKTNLKVWKHFPPKYIPEYAYASSIQDIFKSKEYNNFLNEHYTLIFENISYGNYVRVYKRKI